MRGFIAVFQREVAERRLLFPAALAVGLFPLLAPFLKSSAPAAEARGASALLLAGITAALLALLLGGSVLARDLSERRLGFYFARPLSGWAIWGGKLAAALALTFGAAVLVLLPALLFGPIPWGGPVLPLGLSGADLAAVILGLLVLFFVAQAVSVMVRSRSPWMALDLAAAAAVVALVAFAVRRLTLAFAFGARGAMFPLQWLVPAALVAFAAASAAQVLLGRTDIRRAHRSLSLTLWGGLLVCALAVVGYSQWVLAAEPEDLETIETLIPAPAGSWVSLQGRAARRYGYSPAFLLDVGSGRFLRTDSLGREWWPGYASVFSDDGRRAAWLAPRRSGTGYDLVAADLDARGARTVRALAGFDRFPQALALSPDGRQAAAFVRDRLLVQELASGRLLASVPAHAPEEWEGRRLRFLGRDRLRAFELLEREGRWEILASDLEIATGKLGATVRIGSSPRYFLWNASSDGERLLLRERGSTVRRLYDARTGAFLAEIAGTGQEAGAVFLADGRIAMDAARQGGGRELRLFDRDGTAVARYAFPAAADLRIGGVSRGTLSVGAWPAALPEGSGRRPGLSAWRGVLLDLETGRRRELGRGLAPLGWGAAGGPLLFEREGGGLVVADPATGALRTVLRSGQ